MSKLDDLSRLIAGRNTNLFQDDINSFHDKLESVISGSRILVIGGAGSIGSSTVQLICNYNPKHICNLVFLDSFFSKISLWNLAFISIYYISAAVM